MPQDPPVRRPPGQPPRAEQAAEVKIGFRVAPSERAIIDQLRGDEPLAVYLRRCALRGAVSSDVAPL